MPDMRTGSERQYSVFVIGDSISMHYGPWLAAFLDEAFSYGRKAGEAAAMEDLDMPRGANGGDSENVRRYLETNAMHGEIPNVDYLLVNCGLHDIKTDPVSGSHQVEPDAYRRNLEEIVRLGRDVAEELVWISTTSCDDAVHNSRQPNFHRYRKDVNAYNSIALDLMGRARVPVIDLYQLTAAIEEEPGSAVYEDHVHFVPEVRRIQASFIGGWLKGHAQQ